MKNETFIDDKDPADLNRPSYGDLLNQLDRQAGIILLLSIVCTMFGTALLVVACMAFN